MKNKNEPKQIDLTQQEAESLKQQLLACNLSETHKDILLGILAFNFWLREQLRFAKISIGRLQRLFGFRREKKNLNIPRM